MFKNLFKIALRNILKEKGYSVINILGLAIGITCSMFLGLYIMDELSYDMHHELTIAIACLGLLGLTAFTTERRTKEIGIRKVIGASVKSIVTLLSKEFVVLVLLATLIAFPLAWYFMDTWLQAFAYRISLKDEIPTFILSALIALFIIILTMSYHTIRAATSNPVNALKDE